MLQHVLRQSLPRPRHIVILTPGLGRGSRGRGRGVETFVSDIFQEVDEEVRRERLQKLWDKYGIFVIAAAVVVVAAVGAWRGYEWWQMKRATEASSRFEAAIQLATLGKHEDAIKAFSAVAVEGTAGYRTLARLR